MRMLSTPNMHSASSWTSILTGLNPGRHGLFVFSDRDFATGDQAFFKGGDRQGALISSHLYRHGLTCGFLNVPMTYPAEALPGGFMVSGLDAPSLNERAFAPADLRKELLGRFPDYRFAPDGLGELMSTGRLRDAASLWLKLTEIQTSAAEYLLDTRPVDFFMTVYTASDWAGHNLWKFAGVNGDNLLLEIYRALDDAVARLVSRANGECQIYVISDHGMGRHTGASYHLAAWLERNGFMARKSRSRSGPSMLGVAQKAATNLLPRSVKERMKAGLGDARVERLRALEKDSFYSSIDWDKTSAYTEPGRHVININLEGRNAKGIVKPADYDDVCERIVRSLGQWRDDEGNNVVDCVVRRESAYSGPFVERASDLYVHWNTSACVGEPPEEVKARGFWWSGDHRPEGILICKGPGIRPDSKPSTSKVYDIVPTIMFGAGLPVSHGLDGRVVEEAFTREFLANHPVSTDSSDVKNETARAELSPDEEQMIEEKLRALGYL